MPHFYIRNIASYAPQQGRLLHSQGDVVRDEQGRLRRAFGVAQDITESERW
jgi:hypothetical protein